MSETKEELARELAEAAKREFASLRGLPWEEATGRVRAALRVLVSRRFPDLPEERLDALLDAHVTVTETEVRIRFGDIAAAVLTGS